MKFIQKWIWLFFKEQNTWPRIAFLEKKKAFAWQKKEMQTGILKAFPLDCGVYDWALKDKILSNEETEKDTPEFIAEYRCDSQETYFFRSLEYPDKTIDEFKPIKNVCLMCRKKLTEKPYVLTGGSKKTFSQGIIFGAFLSCFWHGPRDMYVTQDIVPDSSRMNNFCFSFCSLKCLQDYFDRCMDLLEEDIQKVIKAPPEHYWKYDAKGKLRKYKGYPRVSKETDQKIASLWIFRKGNRFYPSGIFSSKTKAEKWIENNRLKGRIAEVKLGKEQPSDRESIPEKLKLSRV